MNTLSYAIGKKAGVKEGENHVILSGDQYKFTEPEEGHIVVVKNEGEEGD